MSLNVQHFIYRNRLSIKRMHRTILMCHRNQADTTWQERVIWVNNILYVWMQVCCCCEWIQNITSRFCIMIILQYNVFCKHAIKYQIFLARVAFWLQIDTCSYTAIIQWALVNEETSMPFWDRWLLLFSFVVLVSNRKVCWKSRRLWDKSCNSCLTILVACTHLSQRTRHDIGLRPVRPSSVQTWPCPLWLPLLFAP